MNRTVYALLSVLFIGMFLLGTNDVNAQSKKKKKAAEAAAAAAKAKAAESARPGMEDLAKKIKGLEKIPGLFTLYRDTTSGMVYMLIQESQIGKKFIYFSYSENGPTSTGHNRGVFRETKVFQIDRYYNRIEFNTFNNQFYFDTLSALYRSREANIVPGMMVSEKIIATNKEGTQLLISADNIFLKETLHQVKPSMSPMAAAMGIPSLGGLNSNKTRYERLRNYPQNTDIIVKYVFEDPYPRGSLGNFTTEDRYVEVLLQHSIIELPSNNYQPRRDDQRVGYFTTQTNDMTTFNAINFRDFIHRWHLEKKDPNAAVSEPVKPITWWIENTTPHPYRETIKKALLQWNLSFEKAGFKNAIEVKIQPDDADWDAGDIRYNVIRWTSSPNPPFGGYGPSFVNPLTGEILGADIMLEFVFLTGRMQSDRLFKHAGMSIEDPMEYLHSLDENHQCNTPHTHFCSVGNALHEQTLFGLHSLKAMNEDNTKLERFVEEALYYLVLHEVGHTLGLMHNMRASQYLSPDELQNIEITKEKGVTASVMDYPALNFANVKGREVQQYNTRPGIYDDWVIEYGYSSAANNPQEEEKRLQTILSRSTEKGLQLGNDADDMRAPGKGMDPRVNVFDMSNDAISFSVNRFKLIQKLMPELPAKYNKDGESYHELRNAFFAMTGEYGRAADVVSRYVGGVFAERYMVGQQTQIKPLTPASYELQKRAMSVLKEYVFGPNAMNMPKELLPFLQPQRRGFGFFSSAEDPKLHDRVLTIQAMPLNHLLAFTTLKRMTDAAMYGNTYSVAELFADLNQAIFADDIKTNISTQRQNLQIYYIELIERNLFSPFSQRYDNIAKSRMLIALQDIKRSVAANQSFGNEESKNHKRYILFKIDQLLEKQTK
jgi:hypothetical protein